MIPLQTGYYWVKLSPGGTWQVVYVIRGENVLFAGLSERAVIEPVPGLPPALKYVVFDREYPNAAWSERLQPPEGK